MLREIDVDLSFRWKRGRNPSLEIRKSHALDWKKLRQEEARKKDVMWWGGALISDQLYN
jgi:hypothetical protein